MNLNLIISSISIFILISCTSNENGSSKLPYSPKLPNSPKPNSINSSSNPIYNSEIPYNDSLVFHLGNDKSLYSLKFIVEVVDRNFLREIMFYKDKNLIQVIKANKYIENGNFQLIDWNFDGYKDITAVEFVGSGGNSYYIWNYSPHEKKYVFNTLLSKNQGLEIDTLSKYIVYHNRAGYESESWDASKYVKNKLVFVKGFFQQRWNDQKGNAWTKMTRTKMVHGILKTTVDSTIDE